MSSVSPTTGEIWYSGTWEDVRDIVKVLNIGEGKMDTVTQLLIEKFQETIDRDMDGILSSTMHVPIRSFNQLQPDGITRRVFPGDIRRAARYWTAGQLVLSEFQQLEQNVTDQAAQMIVDSRRQVYDLTRFTHRASGQRLKSNISKTMPANLQPPQLPEQVSQ